MKTKKLYALSYIFILLLTIAIVFLFVRQENDIYSFDYSFYWGKWERFSYALTHNPLYDLGKIFSSLWKRQYNFLPVVLPSIFYFLPTPSRLSYILSISLCYLSTLFIVFSLLMKKIKNFSSANIYFFLSIIFPVTTASFWAPTLRGYPDIGGMIFIILALLFSFEMNLTVPQSIKRISLLSFLLWFSFAFRRWYLYTIISMYISIPISSFIIHNPKNYIDAIKNISINMIKSAFIFLAFLSVFQGAILYQMLTYHYSQAYSAYQMGLKFSYLYTIHHIGYFVLISSLLGAVVAFLSKKRMPIAFACICLINEVTSFFLFTRTQSPGVQHIMPFSLWVTCLACFFHMEVIHHIKNFYARTLYSSFLLIILSFSLLNSLFLNNNDVINKILPYRNNPITVSNYNEYKHMYSDISNIIENGNSLFVLSSSYDTLNDTMVSHFLKKENNDQILITKHVDLRDGFNSDIIKANYIIVTDPIQTHIVKEGQRIITIPASDLLNNRTIGHAFQKTSYSYTLNNNVKAYIYKKTRPISKEEIKSLLEKFYPFYPQWRFAYSVETLYESQLKN